MPTPTTPVAWLNWLLNQPEEIQSAKQRTSRVLGNLSPVHALIMLILLDHRTGDRRPVTANTISIETSRQVSFSQMDVLRKRGLVTSCQFVCQPHGTVRGWRIEETAVARVTAMRDGLTRMIRIQNQTISIFHELAELLAAIGGTIPLRPETRITPPEIPVRHLLPAIEQAFRIPIPDSLTATATAWDLSRHIRKHSPRFTPAGS